MTASHIQITLIGHNFKIACTEQDKPIMQEAARIVEEKNGNIKSNKQVVDSERAAVMTALQLAFEARKTELDRPADPGYEERIGALCAKIDGVL